MPLRVLLAAGALAAVTAPAAHAQSWSRVTPPGASIDQVSVARTPADGVLHVAWKQRVAPNNENVVHTVIAPNGRVGQARPIVAGWTGVMDPAIVVVPGGLRAFWGGFENTNSDEPNQDLNTAFSPGGSGAWDLAPDTIIPAGSQAYGSDVAATTLPGGGVLQAWAGTLGTWVHSGLSKADPNTNYMENRQYGYFPGIASNAAGAAVMAWFSSAPENRGVLAQAVAPNGAPASGVARLPGTEAMVQGGTVSRTPIVARAGANGGFWSSYGVGNPPTQVRVWRVGPGGPALTIRATGGPETALAADQNGRLWITWSDGGFGAKRILARRSNRTATVWGATVNARAVRGAHSVYSLDASATAGALDVLANFGTGTAPAQAATFTERVFPGLTLKASRTELGREPRDVTFTVTDAGDPVSGATVTARGRSGRTRSNGKVTLRDLSGSAVARATKANYTAARLRLR